MGFMRCRMRDGPSGSHQLLASEEKCLSSSEDTDEGEEEDCADVGAEVEVDWYRANCRAIRGDALRRRRWRFRAAAGLRLRAIAASKMAY
jgi:hypothetical protein